MPVWENGRSHWSIRLLHFIRGARLREYTYHRVGPCLRLSDNQCLFTEFENHALRASSNL